MPTPQHPTPTDPRLEKAGAWVDLGLTLPIFLLYHLGVVFLDVRNASDLVTGYLLQIAEGSTERYLIVTLLIGLVFAGVFWMLGRGQAVRPSKFAQIAVEGVLYAILLRLGGSYAVTKMLAASDQVAEFVATPHVLLPSIAAASSAIDSGPFVGFVMSLGAGFYEELTYRVLLFGLGAKLLVGVFAHQRIGLEGSVSVPRLTLKGLLITLAWSIVSAVIFSAVHYIGPLGDAFELPSFLFRAVLGLMLTAIYVFRGFAAAVWTHAVYDVWVLVF
jgi:hypothetical protein